MSEVIETRVAETRRKPEPIPYLPVAHAAGMLDESGRLVAVPTDFHPDFHQPLQAKDFASKPLYMRWRAVQLEGKAEVLRAEAVKMRVDADKLEQQGGKETSTKLRKLDKMREEMKRLTDELKSKGVDVSAILDG